MAQKQQNFKKKLAFGKEGEHEVADYFMKKEYSILPLYQFDDDIAPKIFTFNEEIISPDLFICGNNKTLWVEVKTKNRWIKFRGVIETGCNERHYNDYIKVKKHTQLPLYMVFNHKDVEPLGFYFVEISTPYNRIWDGLNEKTGKRISPPLVLWNFNDLQKLTP